MDERKRMIPQSRASQIRDKENKKTRLYHKSVMDTKRVNKEYNDAQNVNGAFNDKYMMSVYEQVKNNPTTHSDELTRHNGSWQFNKSLKRD